jgi:manganese/iron transport system ATP-binding protein/manganese/zinc/iron transport system ATP- binding protein
MESETQQSPIIHLENASMGYKNDSELVLENITISFYPGDQVAVIGPNGAGKSTLFKTIVGLIPPINGEVTVHGGRGSSHKDCVSYIPQKESIDWNYPITVRDVVMMGRYGKIPFLRNPNDKDREIVDSAMERMDVITLADRKIRDCSGGQQQRVFLARSLAQHPHILLMDEPFNAVDVATEQVILDNLRIFRENQVTTLVATHDLSLVSENFERTLILNKRIIAYGLTREVMIRENLQEAFGKKAVYY